MAICSQTFGTFGWELRHLSHEKWASTIDLEAWSFEKEGGMFQSRGGLQPLILHCFHLWILKVSKCIMYTNTASKAYLHGKTPYLQNPWLNMSLMLGAWDFPPELHKLSSTLQIKGKLPTKKRLLL